MFIQERLNGYIAMHQGWCNSQNVRATVDFTSKIETWKYNALFETGKGRPAPPPPSIPMLKAVNVEQCTVRFMEWESGLPQVFDFYVETPMPVPANAFDLAPPQPPQPNDPVAGPDGNWPNQFLVAQGDQHRVGEIIEHPKHGRLMKFGNATPFGVSYRWIALR